MELFRFSCILCSIICAVFIGKTDAAISSWTNPAIPAGNGTGTATPSIPEDTAMGSTGVTIAATVVGNASYAIVSQTTSGKLTIDSSSGLLSLASGSFNFTTEPTYTLTITCTDDDDGAIGTATVTLSISVTAANNAPIFAQSQYAAVIKDGATEGASLITITATDVDADTLSYSITGGNTAGHWTIGMSTGAITVNIGVTLAQGTTGGYSLTVTATDSGGLTATTTVWVAVTTCNGGIKAVTSGLLIFFSCLAALL